MADKTSICNRALQLLGATRISNIDDDDPNARSCKSAFEPRRDALLRLYTWSFSIKRVQLAADATAPAFGFARSYTLPAGAISLAPPDEGDPPRDWVVEDGKILTNDYAPLDVRYVDTVEDVAKMDPLFREALAADMAETMCEDITQSNAKRQTAITAKKDALRDARSRGAIEKGSQASAESSWISVRRG